MKRTILFNLIIILILMFSSSKLSLHSSFAQLTDEEKLIFMPVIEKLLTEGIDTNFIINAINSSEIQFNDRYVRINVTNFANKVDYSHNWNSKSVSKSRDYLRAYREILELAESEYGVPKEIITSILFIETRHGEYLGNNNVMSVYFSTALCNEPEFIQNNIDFLIKNKKDSDNVEELTKKIIERSERKSKWAYEQIKALYKMSKIAPFDVFTLNGSWAGAFGISQFLPSSYLNWAIDGNKDNQIDLFNHIDAIYSVANYLKSNGWGITSESQRKAVFHYNNSNAYVDAVFRLADSLKSIQLSNSK